MTTAAQRTGHDFQHYKRATVLRRIERRLQVNAPAGPGRLPRASSHEHRRRAEGAARATC